MRLYATTIVLLIATTGSAPAWIISQTKDPMTDRINTWAEVTSNGATLLVGCMNGRVEARLTWPQRIGIGSDIGVTYRIDQGPVVPRLAFLAQDGRTLYPPWGTGWWRSAKRVRVQISGEVFDFDTSQGNAAIPAIRCAQ